MISMTDEERIRDAQILEMRLWVAALLKVPIPVVERLLRAATDEQLLQISTAWQHPLQDRPAIVRLVTDELAAKLDGDTFPAE